MSLTSWRGALKACGIRCRKRLGARRRHTPCPARPRISPGMALFKPGEIPGKIPGKIELAAREQKITLGEMRHSGPCRPTAATIAAAIRSAISAVRWPDEVRLSDLEARFACKACGKRGADVRPNFNWNARGPAGRMGYRAVPKYLKDARRASTNCQYSSRMQFGLDYWSRRPLSWPRGLCHARAHCIDRFGRQVSTSSGIDFSEPPPQLHSVLILSSEDIPPPGLGNVGCCP